MLFVLLFICFLGGALLNTYGHIHKALSVAYPEYPWIPWRFKNFQENWDIPENVRNFFEFWGKELKIENLDGWYNVTRSQLELLQGIFRPDDFLACNYNLYLQIVPTRFPPVLAPQKSIFGTFICLSFPSLGSLSF